jgi:hypothetical protein
MAQRRLEQKRARLATEWEQRTGEIMDFRPMRAAMQLDTSTTAANAHSVHAKTTYLRANYTLADVDLLQQIVEAPEPAAALRLWEANHPSTFKPKRIDVEPDPVDTTWRSRPERHLNAEELIRQQFSGRALARELKRLR